MHISPELQLALLLPMPVACICQGHRQFHGQIPGRGIAPNLVPEFLLGLLH